MTVVKQTTAPRKPQSISNTVPAGTLFTSRTIGLVVACTLVFILRMNTQQTATATLKENSEIRWQQPDEVSLKYPTTIENKNWTLDFNTIENLLWESQIRIKPFYLDDQTVDLLENISNALLNTNPTFDLNRLQFLIQQSLPDEGEVLADILTRYLAYRNEYDLWFNSVKTLTLDKQLVELNRSKTTIVQLQNKHFGLDTAQKLFSERNASTFLMIDKQIDLLSTTLNNHTEEHTGVKYDTKEQ
jgi:hypothetical protein